MVKRQKEKQYQSAREHRTNAQLRAGTSLAGSSVQRRLPFHCCALSLTPYENPVCTTTNGIVFDNAALLPFLLKHKVDPVTGTPMSTRDIISLHMDKDEEGRWQCPVLTKPFSDQTKIVAIRQPGTNEANVYSFEAYHELNVKAKNYEDLISGRKFSKKDVIVLNDPNNDEQNRMRDINNFHHIRLARTEETARTTNDNVKHSVTAERIMEKIKEKQKEQTSSGEKRTASDATSSTKKKLKIFSDAVTGVQMTSGKLSGSLTSTAMEVSHESDVREATQEEVLSAQFQYMRKLKKKGYVTMRTNLGDIGLELHCDIAPRTCTNFLGLAEQGKYNGTKFHRLIRNFMIQGGKSEDPSEDQSLWGEPFVDEFDDRLKHAGSGVLSMANAGAGTNKRQFFLTFKSCSHLDRKHSVFGRVVHGLDVLQQMELVPTDKKDRPTKEIKIIMIEVLQNPAREAEEAERIRIEQAASTKQAEQDARRASALGRKGTKIVPGSKMIQTSVRSEQENSSVGKYLPKAVVQTGAASQGDEIPNRSRLPKPPKKTSFGDFSSW